MAAMKPGVRLRSVVGDTEVIVIRSAEGEVDLRCGGEAMVAAGSEAPVSSVSEGLAGETKTGERYWDEDRGVEVLITRGGVGTLSVGADVLARKMPKRLPSSD
jgi:hypothetical protein